MPSRVPASLRREILAHDDGIARHDAALEQAEQRGDDVERRQAVEQSRATRRRPAAPSRAAASHAADAVGDEAGADAADDAEAEHQRQHLGAARRRRNRDRRNRRRYGPAASTSPHSRRRRRCTAAPAARSARGRALPRALRPRRLRRACSTAMRRRSTSASGSIVDEAEHADADMGRAPAVRRDEMLHDRRPDRAGEIVAGRADADRDAAPRSNQCEMSAISGPKLAEQPRPMSSVRQRELARCSATQPVPR